MLPGKFRWGSLPAISPVPSGGLAAMTREAVEIVCLRLGLLSEDDLATAQSGALGLDRAGAVDFPDAPLFGDALKSGAIAAASVAAFSGIHAIKDGALGATLQGFAKDTAGSALLHGTVGGTMSVAQGGKFHSGFLAGGFGDLAGSIGHKELGFSNNPSTPQLAKQTAFSAVVGGAASALGGGKFGNGAITGAFGYLFNQMADRNMFGGACFSTTQVAVAACSTTAVAGAVCAAGSAGGCAIPAAPAVGVVCGVGAAAAGAACALEGLGSLSEQSKPVEGARSC